MGDQPEDLLYCVVIEGELFWKVKWQSKLIMSSSSGGESNSFAASGDKSIIRLELIESFEAQTDLIDWNCLQFDTMRKLSL